MQDNGRFPWYLLTGLILGLGGGLLLAWVVAPIQRANAEPSLLREDFKDAYRELIAFAYVASGDVGRAQARLELLGDGGSAGVLAEQAQRMLAEEGTSDAARALGSLASHLDYEIDIDVFITPTSDPAEIGTPEPENGSKPPSESTATQTNPISITNTPTTTLTPLPTHTPTATQGAAYTLSDLSLVCDESIANPLIQIFAYDAAGLPVSGMEISVSWEGGEDSFVTGMKPEIDPGYADFEMLPGVMYILHLSEGDRPVTGLSPVECESDDGGRFWGSWRIVFIQP